MIKSIWPILILLVCGCRTEEKPKASVKALTPERAMERIVVAAEQRGFVTAQSRKPFHPWGMNYGNKGRLVEDYWNEDWPTLASDFHELHALGANVVRVHLQYGKFMTSPDQPNEAAFGQLQRLLKLADECKLYLDITGLASYRPSDAPSWYDTLAEPERWAAEAKFWESVAQVCAANSVVFCYDLLNEPLSPAEKRAPGKWRSGSLFGGYDFLQYIALDPAGRKRDEIAVQWIRRMTAAIRRYDRETLITVGLLPWSPEWKHLSGFLPDKVGPELSFISVHLYPDHNKPGEALKSLRQFAVGKPIVIEETFQLSCSVAELEEFLRASNGIPCGWIGHYDGQSPAELDALRREGKMTPAQGMYRDWLLLFQRLKPEFAP